LIERRLVVVSTATARPRRYDSERRYDSARRYGSP
jgi:hypothetical protein